MTTNFRGAKAWGHQARPPAQQLRHEETPVKGGRAVLCERGAIAMVLGKQDHAVKLHYVGQEDD